MGTIKSFKKFIEESIWSDMQDRSAGDNVRKEDEYDIDEKELERNVDQCIKTYVISSVYYDKYDGSSDTFLKCIQEWDRCICGNPHLYDRRFGKYVESIKVIPSYIKENWETGKSYKSLVDKKISEEEKKVKDAGFIKKPGESISDTLSKWFDENFEKLGDDFCEEIEEYNDEYHSEGSSRSVDLGVEDWWDNLEYIEQVEIYQDYMKKTNESIWSDMQDRSAGDTVRQEEFTEEFIDKVESNLIGFTMLVVYYIKNYELTLDGFYKYLEENENPDKVKKIIYYVKTHKDECDKLLEKDIKFENKLLDEKVNVYLLRFVDDIVYDEKYHNTLSDIKKFASEIFKGYKRSYDFHINNKMVFKDKSELFNDYIEDKWKNSSLKQKIDDWIKDENDKISKYGFVKEPGKTISETVNDWWYSLDEDKRDDLGWDEFGDDAEEEYYTDNNPKYNEYWGEDFEADEWWDAAYGIRKVKIYCHEHSKTNESIWSDMQDRSAGDVVRKEDEMTSDDYRNLKEVLKMFGREVRFFGVNKNQKFFPVNAKTYGITLEDCLYFIDVLANGKFTGVDFSKLKKYIEANWEQDPMIKNIIQWTVDGENNKGIDRKIRNSVKREKTWDLYECDGVPGGLTPADVGGMGPAYFPGPNGEPGSGDLPSPTGIVYKQVAPFDSFIKIRKQKKKKKKFRKEDEPCVHSENPPIYSHVDDSRDYVDRTYNNIDKRK